MNCVQIYYLYQNKKRIRNLFMTFNSLILYWFDENRRNLPWRNQNDPYKIWLSEIILQQTRVAQGTDYYLRFVENFPTVQSLSEASEQEVLRLWQGLGYYSRARNLHFSAKFIHHQLQGIFPDNFQDLMQLKGVGEYTAAAIASIAFNQAVPALDGNAFRVYTRYFNIHMDTSSSKTRKYIFNLVQEIIDKNRPGDFNQAIMELGALICLPKNPKCSICPLQNSCEALAKNTIHLLPIKLQKTKVRNRTFNFLEISDSNHYLMTQRIEKDVWQNLFTLPLIESKKGHDVESELFQLDENFEKVHQEIHLLSHQKLTNVFWRTTVETPRLKELAVELKANLYAEEEFDSLPLPRPIEKFLNEDY